MSGVTRLDLDNHRELQRITNALDRLVEQAQFFVARAEEQDQQMTGVECECCGHIAGGAMDRIATALEKLEERR